jgi:predicted DNA-binding WGR domain protein
LGLLVKNLENIQGDERDIILLSVCYGRGPNGKMLMNFGPINQIGGEKRLNVAFSRAKQNMALVSSIQYSDITNDFNDGARCLKNYLRYARAASIGDLETVKRILRENLVRPDGSVLESETRKDIVVGQIAADLGSRGYHVDLDIGQSSFRCDLAVRRPDEVTYSAGVLVDTEAYYRQTDIIERDVTRPSLLEGFGWRIMHVLAKDWYRNRSSVLNSLVQFIEREALGEVSGEIHSKGRAPPSEAAETESPNDEEPIGAVAPEDLTAETDSISEMAKISFAARTDSPSPSRVSQWKRYFEFTSGTSHKFWEITMNDHEHTVRFGRIGSAGQEKTKSFYSAMEAEKDARRLINEKIAKGYVESK